MNLCFARLLALVLALAANAGVRAQYADPPPHTGSAPLYSGANEPQVRRLADAATTVEHDRDPGFALAEHRRLERALTAVQPQRPGVVDAYVISVALDSDGVFGREARETGRVLGRRYDAAGRTIVLDMGADDPRGSPDHLAAALARVAEVMDPKGDVLVLYTTSHGAPWGVVYNDSDSGFGAISPTWLWLTLQTLGIQNRLLLLSACYSGAFVPMLASDQEQLKISRQTLTAFAETLRLTREQFRVGVASELEARQAETNYQQARSDIATLETQVAQDQNALNLLVGTTVPAEQLPDGLGVAAVTRDALPGDLSSTVLLRRPDVLQAEHQLIAQNANIGAARAAFFPTISLTATLGTIATGLSGLFAGGSFTYTGAPSVGLPLFDGGRRKGNLEYARASEQVAVSTYERAVQTAFREVADALAARGRIDERVSAQTARTEAAVVAARLSEARYRAGVDSFLVSLDAQRTAYSARQQLTTTRLTRASNLVELYRALGGGLADDPAAPPSPPLPARKD